MSFFDRSLIFENQVEFAEQYYKIIYQAEKEMVIVTDVFDTRQQPEKLIKRNRE